LLSESKTDASLIMRSPTHLSRGGSFIAKQNNGTGYDIERSPASVGPYAPVGATDASTMTYRDDSVSASSAYYYRVRSRNTVADSLPSEPAIATTLAASNEGGASDGGGGGGCFIATAAYGSPLAAEVVVLRAFRDRYLLTNAPGIRFVNLYYRLSPPLARFIGGHESGRTVTCCALFPLVYGIRHPPCSVGLLVAATCCFPGLVISLRCRRRRSRTRESLSR
jgi:hypothetical protein